VECLAYLKEFMKIRILIISLILFFSFYVLFKALDNSNIYIPKTELEKKLIKFKSVDLYSGIDVTSDKIFEGSNFYILNIWSSWCKPCREEHSRLIELSKNLSFKIIGLNYKDNEKNAKKFINELGNPYSTIIVDKSGTISIKLGAYGVPETFLISKEKKIIKKFIGPLNDDAVKEINLILK